MNSRLLEIREAIDPHLRAILDLRAEEAVIISARFRLPGPMLEFDADGRTIRWIGGEVVLGGKSYRFVRVLWATKKKRMKASDLENIVWEGRIVSSETVRNFVWRLSNRLKLADCPVEIKSIKKPQTLEVTGFKLRVAFRCISDATNATG